LRRFFSSRNHSAFGKEVLDNARQGKETSNHQLLLHTKSNEIRLPVNATTRRDENGNIVGVWRSSGRHLESAGHDREMELMANESAFIETANAPILDRQANRGMSGMTTRQKSLGTLLGGNGHAPLVIFIAAIP
jgi:hypothetical protein